VKAKIGGLLAVGLLAVAVGAIATVISGAVKPGSAVVLILGLVVIGATLSRKPN
jgi:hypothetical protein